MLDKVGGWVSRAAGAMVADWPYKLVSLSIAGLAWLYVQSDEVHEDQVRAAVHWTLAPGLVAVDPLPATVALRVRGTRAAIRRADQADVALAVDISDIGPGDHSLEFEPFPLQGMPGALEVLARAPSGVRFTLDAVAERKVKVQPQVVGDPAPGFAVDAITLVPAVALVRGPAVVVEGLGEVHTEPIDVTGLAGNATLPIALDLPRGVSNADGTRFEAEVAVLALNDERTFAAVPVFVWNQPDYRPVEPTVQVRLQGPAAALAALAPDDLAAFAHLPAGADAARYEVAWGPVDGPRLRVLHGGASGVRVSGVEPSRVEIQR